LLKKRAGAKRQELCRRPALPMIKKLPYGENQVANKERTYRRRKTEPIKRWKAIEPRGGVREPNSQGNEIPFGAYKEGKGDQKVKVDEGPLEERDPRLSNYITEGRIGEPRQ